MAKKMGKRIYRPATEDEKARHHVIREQIAAELPEIRRRARARLRDMESRPLEIRHAIAELKAERERQGLSIADVKERTGIDHSALARLENNDDANPTVNTLVRYADAVGKQILIVLSDVEAI